MESQSLLVDDKEHQRDQAHQAAHSKGRPRGREHVKQRLWNLYLAVLHITSLALVITSAWPSRNRDSAFGLLPSELPFASHVVEYETKVFDPSGFAFDENDNETPYEGAPTETKNGLWKELFSVGMASLTNEEYDLLGLETITVGGHPVVTIEVFHQLHCVDYLRRRAYETDGIPFNDEEDWSREHHLSHCIDYLRQVIMCHGDLTPITLKWSEFDGRPMPNFHIQHTCRNFDKIYEFALARNTSGMTI